MKKVLKIQTTVILLNSRHKPVSLATFVNGIELSLLDCIRRSQKTWDYEKKKYTNVYLLKLRCESSASCKIFVFSILAEKIINQLPCETFEMLDFIKREVFAATYEINSEYRNHARRNPKNFIITKFTINFGAQHFSDRMSNLHIGSYCLKVSHIKLSSSG